MAALDLSPGGDREYSLGVTRLPHQPTDKASQRGTVLHERREGEKAAVFVNGGDLLLRVSCRTPTGELASNEIIPYGLAVSIEVGVESSISVYDEIRARIAQPLRGSRV